MKDQWIEWLQDKQRHFFYGVTFVVASFFVAFQLFGKFHKPQKKAALVQNEVFENWLVQGEAFDKLEEAIANHPELETKFGAKVADRFIVQNEGDKAEPFAENVFQRILKQTPEHALFAKGSLMIAKGELSQALAESNALQERLDEDTLLYGFNLVRIASLYRALEMAQEEHEALQKLDTYLQTHEKTKEVLTECFQEGELTLTDYIKERASKFAP